MFSLLGSPFIRFVLFGVGLIVIDCYIVQP